MLLVYPSSKGVGICTVPMAGAVTTGEINYYNFIVQLCSLPLFAEMFSQGYRSTTKRPLTSEDGLLGCHLSKNISMASEGISDN